MEKFKFCPKCANTLIIKRIHSHDRQVCPNCGFIFYHNPAPTVGIFPIDSDNRVLLCRRGIEPFKGWWDSIGGFMEEGESPQETAVREAKEETGLDVELLELLGAGKDYYGDQSIVPIAYLAKVIGGEMQPADDVDDLSWFPLDELPQNIAFVGNKKALESIKRRAAEGKLTV